MKFKKNTTIDLGGWDIKIKSVDKDYKFKGDDGSLTGDFMGIYIPADREILICEEIIQDREGSYEETVLHELFHALCDYCGFPLDEKYHGFVNLIHSALKQLLEEKK